MFYVKIIASKYNIDKDYRGIHIFFFYIHKKVNKTSYFEIKLLFHKIIVAIKIVKVEYI